MPGRAREIVQDLVRRRGVLVRKHVDLGARQAAAVDDAGVVQRVRYDVVVRSEDGRDRACVGRESGLEHHAGFGVLELRNAAFQLHVQAHGARNGTDGARACAIFLRRRHRGFDELGVIGQAEIIVAGEIDDFAAIKAGNGFAGRFQHAQALISTGLLPTFELFTQIGEWFRCGHAPSS